MADFTSQLANLQRSANRASSTSSSSPGGRGGGLGGGGRGRGSGRGGGRERWNDDYHHRGGGRRREGGGGGNYYSGNARPRDDDHRYNNDRHSKRRRGGGGGGRYHHRDNDRHDNSSLASIIERVPQYQPPPPATTTTDTTESPPPPPTEKHHLTLCFLTIHDILHEHIWREWLSSSTTSSSNLTVSIICHAKYPQSVKSPWLQRRLLVEKPKKGRGNELAEPKFRTYRPDWGSVEITRAMIELIKEGLRIGEEVDDDGGGRNEEERWLDREEENDDRFSKRRYIVRRGGDNDGDTATPSTNENKEENDEDKILLPKGSTPSKSQRFIFLSETCIPIATLTQVENALFHNSQTKNKSWLKARSTPNNGYARQKQWDCISKRDVPPTHVWKADQWIVLTREHALSICRLLPRFLGEEQRVSGSGGGGRGGGKRHTRELWECFRKTTASDEIYFPTALSIMGIIHRPNADVEVEEDDVLYNIGAEVVRKRVTYCDWSTCAKNPASFGKKDLKEVVRRGRSEGCLIARKFGLGKDCGMGIAGKGKSDGGGGEEGGLLTVEEWKKVVVGDDS